MKTTPGLQRICPKVEMYNHKKRKHLLKALIKKFNCIISLFRKVGQ